MTPKKEKKPVKTSENFQEWSIEDAKELYGIERWGLRYFDISSKGDVMVAPLKEKGASIKILDVVDEALEQGLHFPMLIRFQDLLRDRVERINHAFNDAIAEFNLV